MKPIAPLMLLLAGFLTTSTTLQAQTEEAVPPPPALPASSTELDSWLAPIALYPDPLLAQVLNAATKPSDVALAGQYLADGGDPNQVDAQPWDPSVKALTHYPGVVKMMADYLPWTTALGQAYVEDEPTVIDEIQHLRTEAMDLGNLESTPEENVLDEDGSIEIVPTEPEVIYLPEYDSDVVYTQPLGPGGISFGRPCAMGLWMNRDFDWHRHEVLVWDHIYQRPADWWSSRRPSHPVTGHIAHHQHGEGTDQNARTRPSYFVLWRVPQVQVVNGNGAALHGAQAGEFHQHHIEHLGAPKPSNSSLVVLPNRGAMAAAHGQSGASSFHVFPASTPAHTTEVIGAHHLEDATSEVERHHGFTHGNHETHGTHEGDTHSHQADSHPTAIHHNSGDSHTTSTGHTTTPSHSGGGGGRR